MSQQWKIVFDEDGRHIGFRASTGEPEFHLYNGSNSTVDEVVAALNKAAQYEELIYAVARKYPGETRHQTALRYIMQREQEPHGETGAKQAEKK